MPHDYKNYVHLEGVVERDATVTQTVQGKLVTFTLAVRSSSRDSEGTPFKLTDVFPIEVGRENTRFVSNLRKGTPVTIDGSVKLTPVVCDGSTHTVATITAHRVHTIDYNGWKKEAGSAEEEGDDSRAVINDVLAPADAEQFEWQRETDGLLKYKHIQSGRNLYIDADTGQFCSSSGKPISREAALRQATSPK